MERLAWIEIIDRYGDVKSRHAIKAWPLKVGRDYGCDLILDDPYVAPQHVEISAGGGSGFQLKDLGSINGLTVSGMQGRKSDVTIAPDDIFRIGHTQLRLRPCDYPVVPEMQYSRRSWQRRPSVLFASILVLLGVLQGVALLDYNEEGLSTIAGYVVIMCLLTVLWMSAWSFGGRLFAGKTNFIPHAVIACLGMTLLLASAILVDYAAFALDSAFIGNVSIELTFLIISLILYQHLRLVSRASRKHVAGMAAAAAMVLIGANLLVGSIRSERDLEQQSFRSTIGPRSLLLVEGKSPEAFISTMDEMKSRLQD